MLAFVIAFVSKEKMSPRFFFKASKLLQDLYFSISASLSHPRLCDSDARDMSRIKTRHGSKKVQWLGGLGKNGKEDLVYPCRWKIPNSESRIRLRFFHPSQPPNFSAHSFAESPGALQNQILFNTLFMSLFVSLSLPFSRAGT